MKKIVVAGIGTDVGKTLVSAILVEALQADYWKPVQSGKPTDTETVRSFISNSKSVLHPETFCLQHPLSPHAAAQKEGVEINLDKLSLPVTNNHLIIELAGGLMVPLNDKELNIDLLKKWKFPVVLVSQNYLGSINHTLLSIEALQRHDVPLSGIIFNGEENTATENFILNYCKVECLGRISSEPMIDRSMISRYATIFKEKLNSFI